MKCRTSNAWPVTSRSLSSSETSPRQRSDDSTSVGLKCLRAKVDLPAPEGPTRTTRDSSGIWRLATAEDSHLGRGPGGRIVGADGQEADGVAEACGLAG